MKRLQFFKQIILNLGTPIIIFEAKTGKIIFTTSEAEKLFGYSKVEFEKLSLPALVPEQEEKIAKAFTKSRAKLELEFVKKNRRRFTGFGDSRKFRSQNQDYISLIIRSKSFRDRKEIIKTKIQKDPLTKVLNYRSVMEKFKQEFERAKSKQSAFSIIMIDVDNLNVINENLGYSEGDRVLKNLASVIAKNIRGDDTIGRLGEDSFLVLLFGAEKRPAYNLANRILDSIASISVTKGEKVMKVASTLSVASYPEDKCENIVELLQKAKSLIQSGKDMGGNTVVAFDEYMSTANLMQGMKKEKTYTTFQNQLQLLTKKLHSTILETIMALANAVKAKDYYTEKHSEFTSYYAGLLAQELNVHPDEIESVKIGAILHDIGKIGISDDILNKRGPLNEKERELINLHPEIGVNIIKTMKFLKDIIPIILYHHERFDGQNNRWGLKGKEIPLGARIVSVIDVYHALVSDRPYRKALSKKEAIQIIKSERGKLFDPDVVDAFLRVLERENSLQLKT